MNNEIAVLGGGSWGTALTCQVAKKQQTVHLVMRDEKIIVEILTRRTNSKYLGSIKLPTNIIPTSDYQVLLKASTIILALPSSSLFSALSYLKSLNLKKEINLLIATKGLCKNPVELISTRLSKLLPNKIAFITGPNFAKEVAANFLTHATIASNDIGLATDLASFLSTDSFIVNPINDIITVQIAAIMKNIIAILSGYYTAKNYGENARAALICNGLKEISLVSKALGGKEETIKEVGVLGDLILTCYSTTSRNTKFGYELASQKNPKQFITNYPHLIEGKEAAGLIIDLVKPFDLDIPIINKAVKLLFA